MAVEIEKTFLAATIQALRNVADALEASISGG